MKAMKIARARHRILSVRWGYIWAFWCAVFWGAWYLPGTAVWHTPPYSLMSFESTDEFMLAAAVITAFNGIGALIFLFLWLAFLEKLGELWRTLSRFRTISKWYFLAAIFGGPCALFGSYLAIGFVGPIFAAVAALLYPIIGASLARLWYNEKITLRAAIGILVIVIGGVSIFAPGIMSESAAARELLWIGFVGGAMAAFGWGVEGAIAGRALDVTDPDVGITIRFVAEVIIWLFLILPGVALFFDAPVIAMVSATLNFWAILWLLLAGLSFGFCYVAWYKSFPLIGVGRGQAIGALYGVFAVIFLAIFAFQFPDWNFLLGLSLTVSGSFLMISESSDVVEVVRAPSAGMKSALTIVQAEKRGSRLHMKGYILRELAEAADNGLWDYEIMRAVFHEYGRKGDYWKGEIRVTLTDLFSGALIEEIEDALDDGRYFGENKILMKFKISPFGMKRMSETGLI
ncbi:MAG TPA: DMT family transporter [Gammaproteobacteria bacterium]|nr:DMT family transporter [Candidatus Neomarinimicrobiota bacterium]MBT5176139.1 DMT family transporter [Candidatus Neomarinimicrobiota bacterium]MBT6636658.1 DMT family transporter [Candidatus Neomarinimicrobiota bacterium]HIJ22793.1 DMT family transporter [Gammaproteobacteria bacterium]